MHCSFLKCHKILSLSLQSEETGLDRSSSTSKVVEFSCKEQRKSLVLDCGTVLCYVNCLKLARIASLPPELRFICKLSKLWTPTEREAPYVHSFSLFRMENSFLYIELILKAQGSFQV